MKIVETHHVEDCFDGSLIKEILLDKEITKEFVFYMGTGGQVQYFAHFERPFFKVRLPDRYDLKGIAGNLTMRVHLKHPDQYTMQHLEHDILAFRASLLF